MGFDKTVFVQANYAPINGLQLANLLSQNIIAICGPVDSTNSLTAEQVGLIDALNKGFAIYAQNLGN